MERTLKIGYIVPRFVGPYGGERHMLHYASLLGKAGHEVVIYTHRFSPDCRHLLFSDNVRVVETGFPRLRSQGLEVSLSYLFASNLVLRVRGRFDLIQAWGAEGAVAGFMMRRLFRRYSRTPMVLVTGEPPRFAYDLRDETGAGKNWLWRSFLKMAVPVLRYLDRKAVNSMDGVVVNNDWVSGQFREIYGSGLDYDVIYPGIEFDRFTRFSREEARSRLGLSPEQRVYLSVSKLHARKRIDRAMQVYAEHSAGGPESVFLVIGDGPEEAALKGLARRMGMESIYFLGRRSDEEVALYYQASDYFIFTAKNEPYGIAPMEAKTAGCQLLPEDRLSPMITWEESVGQVVKIYERLIR